MKVWNRSLLFTFLVAGGPCGYAQVGAECPDDEVRAHVLTQFEIYGPRSLKNEYFGFIYRSNEVIASAMVRGGRCSKRGDCTVNTARAAKHIPRGAKVLGEWHTHTRNGSRFLSALDVQGAYANRHIRCYMAYYSTPDGNIQSWDPGASSVPIAMHSVAQLGAYAMEPVLYAANNFVPPEPAPKPAKRRSSQRK